MPKTGCHCKNTRKDRSLDPELCVGIVCVDCGTYAIRLHPGRPWNQRGQDERARSSKHPRKPEKDRHLHRRPGEPKAGRVRTYFVDPETLK